MRMILFSARRNFLYVLIGLMLFSLSACNPDRADIRIFNRTGENLELIDQNGKRFSWSAGTEFDLARRDFRPDFEHSKNIEEGTTTTLIVARQNEVYRYLVKETQGTSAYLKRERTRSGLRMVIFRRILDTDFLIYEADAHDDDYMTRTYSQGKHYPVSPALQ